MVQKVTIVEYLWCKFLVISICNKINEISFGETNERHHIWSNFGKNIAKLSYSLNNVKKKYEQLTSVYQYYLKIVPTKYITFKNVINWVDKTKSSTN